MTKLTEAEIARRLAEAAPLWRLADGAIERTFDTGNWKATIFALNAVAFRAEAVNHHPEATASYRSLRIRLSTHDVGGISDKDIALARDIDALLG